VNAGDAKVQGYDIQANFAKTTDVGRFGINLTGTYYTKFDQTSPGGFVSKKVATMVEANGDPVLDGDNGGVVLRWKHQLAFNYGIGTWGFTLINNYYSGYETGNRQWDGERNFVDGQSLWDLQVAYTGLKNATFRLGVNNLFDKDPPMFVPVSNQFQAGFDATLYDPRARFVYLTANYKFF
jgi:iron complex outermembrane receptor protein